MGKRRGATRSVGAAASILTAIGLYIGAETCTGWSDGELMACFGTDPFEGVVMDESPVYLERPVFVVPAESQVFEDAQEVTTL